MGNVWKGLVIGGLMGALVGSLMDALRAENLERMARGAQSLGAGAAGKARATGAAVAGSVRDAELRDRIHRLRDRNGEFSHSPR